MSSLQVTMRQPTSHHSKGNDSYDIPSWHLLYFFWRLKPCVSVVLGRFKAAYNVIRVVDAIVESVRKTPEPAIIRR